MESRNLYHDIPDKLPAEIFTTLVSSTGVRIERIVSHGHCSPPGFWYDQNEHEWVLLLKGEAILRFEQNNREVRLTEGDYVNIAAHEKHRVEWTKENSDTLWLAVFY